MAETKPEETSLEERRLALEELRERNRADEQSRALDIQDRKVSQDARASNSDLNQRVPIALVSVLSAVVGGVASFGAAYVAGVFDVENTREDNAGQIALERQKFFNQLIDGALEEGSDRERAQRMIFMLDVGVFESELNTQKLRNYAELEQRRVDEGGKGESFLPRGLSGNTDGVQFFFSGGTPALDVFSSEEGVRILQESGALQSAEGLAAVLAVLHYQSAGFRFLVEQHPRSTIEALYADKFGNDGPQDAWAYRGRGFLMLTGKANYARMGQSIGIDLLASPEKAAEPTIALQIALKWMLDRQIAGKNLIGYANSGDIGSVLRGIQGTTFGIETVTEIRDRYLAAISDPQFESHPLVAALD